MRNQIGFIKYRRNNDTYDWNLRILIAPVIFPRNLQDSFQYFIYFQFNALYNYI